MIEFKVERSGRKALAELALNLQKTPEIKRGLSRAMGEHLRLQDRQAVTLMAAQTKLPTSRVSGATSVRHSSSSLVGRLRVRDESVPLGELTSRSWSRSAAGATAGDWDTKTYAGTFIVPRFGGRIYRRTGKGRFPIRRVWGPLLPNELLRPDMPTLPAIERLVESDLAARALRHVVKVIAP
ncbi:hypothetical protein [Ancylobacter amanitiformis]|uniref:Uncharacterized protein n=1 Tax=Ancylobacter amanitiformis TaxID=217069 RepID=A0ABU0LQA1_9HYPH|nr:hypothetical protein [Ancylobacter amanitiformis]MDQ0510893.1 hypothetical protein [Ancylobacter amanitiformis]